MLTIIAFLLALIATILWTLESAARAIIDRLDVLIRTSRELAQPGATAERTGPGDPATADEVLRGMGRQDADEDELDKALGDSRRET
jgi:hypothetical protein